jgi:hypothetical protein
LALIPSRDIIQGENRKKGVDIHIHGFYKRKSLYLKAPTVTSTEDLFDSRTDKQTSSSVTKERDKE